jgi:hypothetical protein
MASGAYHIVDVEVYAIGDIIEVDAEAFFCRFEFELDFFAGQGMFLTVSLTTLFS